MDPKKKRIIFAVVVIVVALILVAADWYFMHVPRRDRFFGVLAGIHCSIRGGDIVSQGCDFGNCYEMCEIPYADAGKDCHSSSDCQGACLLGLGTKDWSADPAGYGPIQGCQAMDNQEEGFSSSGISLTPDEYRYQCAQTITGTCSDFKLNESKTNCRTIYELEGNGLVAATKYGCWVP